MSHMKPRVSIILPTYNRAHTIMEAISSILAQTYENYEVLVIDDGSEDNTKDLMSELSDPRIRYVKSPVNRGVSFARNSGIRLAQGELLAFQDSDDEWMADKLKLQVEALDQWGEEYGLVYTRFFYIKEDGRLEWPPKEIPYHMQNGDIFQYMLLYNPVGGPTMMVRRECIQSVGMFNTDIRAMEDYEFALRIAKHYKLIQVDKLLVKANNTPVSLSKQIIPHVLAGCVLLKLYKEEYVRYDVLERKISELRKLAGRVLSEIQIEQMISQALQ